VLFDIEAKWAMEWDRMGLLQATFHVVGSNATFFVLHSQQSVRQTPMYGLHVSLRSKQSLPWGKNKAYVPGFQHSLRNCMALQVFHHDVVVWSWIHDRIIFGGSSRDRRADLCTCRPRLDYLQSAATKHMLAHSRLPSMTFQQQPLTTSLSPRVSRSLAWLIHEDLGTDGHPSVTVTS